MPSCQKTQRPEDAVRFWASHVSTMTSASREEKKPGFAWERRLHCTHHVLSQSSFWTCSE
ncbi:hypothetical protein QBC45DRAFT_424910 [Copromyces sp. CBS 386.78]|nr:hypothetical protein QBC45DRAFT_424910 [Copromyces sp. CBS 386.78]